MSEGILLGEDVSFLLDQSDANTQQLAEQVVVEVVVGLYEVVVVGQ